MHRFRFRSALTLPVAAAALVVVTASVAGATITPVHKTMTALTPARRATATTTVTTVARRPVRPLHDVATLVRVRVLPGDATFLGSDAARGRHRQPKPPRPPRSPKPPTTSTCAPATPPGASYVLEGWRVPGPLTFHFNPATTPSDVVNAASTFQAAFNAWAAVGAPQISVASDGHTTGPVADHVDEVMFAPLTGNTLGVTDTWKWTDGTVESDTVVNSSAPFFQPASEGCYNVDAYDLQSVVTHEFGHVLGLDHSPSDPASTMYPLAAPGETFKRSPDRTDIAGITALYG